ncbi:hypothetical protein ABFW00_01150, partial [Mycobacteroides abscessus]
MIRSTASGALFIAMMTFAPAFAGADPADPDPFNPLPTAKTDAGNPTQRTQRKDARMNIKN